MTNRRTLWTLWGSVVVVTIALSIWGRPLQRFVRERLSAESLAVAIGVAIAALALAAVVWVVRRRSLAALAHALWLAPLVVFLPPAFPIVEERIHFVLFGLFGFLTLQLLAPIPGLAAGLAAALVDEGLQAFVPDRVADWRDVGMNGAAATIGAVLALAGREKESYPTV